MNSEFIVYPGSFDPITYGHIDLIERALRIFPRVHVVVMENPRKTSLFTLDEKYEMIDESLKGLEGVTVEKWEGLLVDYMRQTGARVVLRGLRAFSDFDYEFQMALANKYMCPEIEIVFLMTNVKYHFLSSSLVKEIFQMGGDVSRWVPPPVLRYLEKKLAKK